MIKHVVFFRLLDEAEGRGKLQNAEIIKSGLEGLIDTIPYLRSIEVGINIPNVSQTDYDICLVCSFDNWEDLNSYAINPNHLKVANYIGKCKVARAAVDYEV